MIRRILISFVLLFISFHCFSQHERFVYTDSFSYSGISPIPAQLIKEKRIRKVSAFIINKKDSSLFKTFLYDTEGNFLKETRYVRNKVIVYEDSSVYDSNNRRIKMFDKSNGEIFFEIESNYRRDSIKLSTTYIKKSSTNKQIDTTYTTEHFNANNQLTDISVVNTSNQLLYQTQYFYSENNLIEKIKGLKEGVNSTYELRYEHIFSRKGRKMILWDAKTNSKITQCTYNKNNQCIECIWFTKPENYTHTFTYNPDGSLHEYTEESYNQWNKKWSWVVTRYHYYQ